jgi:hypothetical protein
LRILRSVNRRDFTVQPAGYFNVLRPNKRFTASHPRGQFGYLPGESTEKASLQVCENAATAPMFSSASLRDQKYLGKPHLLRQALIVFTATALTLFLVWWSAGLPARITF